eukprot:5253197-Amphidinium_carterae.1
MTGGLHNYASIADARDDASAEIERLLDLGYCTKMSKIDALLRFPRGIVSKLAILVKLKPD